MDKTTELSRIDWDYIVVGTGIGGATLGYALAKAGKRVLFCEKGRSHLGETALLGDYAEQFNVKGLGDPDLLAQAGRVWEPIEDRSQSRARQYVPFMGCGSGGSSSLYGMAMERFFPADFAPKSKHPGALDADLPEAWPISYQDLEPYYAEAEELYRVRVTEDPLRGHVAAVAGLHPPPLSPESRELQEFLQAKGLHPYRLPLACEYVPGCRNCQGYLCRKNCKNDSGRICLTPALAEFGAQLLDECEVLRLEATAEAISGVVCVRHGSMHTLRARTVVLAAGALATPAILLRSVSKLWPRGLANSSGLVGKNLMRHFVDLYLLQLRDHTEPDNRHKELAFNDFYQGDYRLGSVQSFGRLPPSSVILASLEEDLRAARLSIVQPLFRLAKPAIKRLLERLAARRMVMATILEDLPYRENDVFLSDSGGIRLRYHVHPYDRSRIQAFRAAMREIFSPLRAMLLKQAENNKQLAHACGTCRFGLNPETSVLDAYNRTHDIKNLLVVDSSFFPTSAGTNPSLTIAANALRVGRHLLGRHAGY